MSAAAHNHADKAALRFAQPFVGRCDIRSSRPLRSVTPLGDLAELPGDIAGVPNAAEERAAASSEGLGAASESSRQTARLTAEVALFLSTAPAAEQL
ncbi:hypothetical protein ACLBWX_01085 [Methylobacterium sp. M6A4_1b]